MLRLLLTILLTIALAAGCKEEGKTSLTTKESVESFLQQQVKTGATRDSVMALDAKGIEHSGNKDPSTIYAMIRVPDEKAVVKRGFQIKFDFAGGKLSGYTVSEKFTGP